MAGYSGTPLAKKLGIKPGMQIYVHDGPDHYGRIVGPLPEGTAILGRLASQLDMIHLFVTDAKELAGKLKVYRHKIKEAGMIWVSWPKKAAKVPTNVTEDVIRDVALPLGLVDTKVCAVDEVWSGLKLVIRVANRKS